MSSLSCYRRVKIPVCIFALQMSMKNLLRPYATIVHHAPKRGKVRDASVIGSGSNSGQVIIRVLRFEPIYNFFCRFRTINTVVNNIIAHDNTAPKSIRKTAGKTINGVLIASGITYPWGAQRFAAAALAISDRLSGLSDSARASAPFVARSDLARSSVVGEPVDRATMSNAV